MIRLTSITGTDQALARFYYLVYLNTGATHNDRIGNIASYRTCNERDVEALQDLASTAGVDIITITEKKQCKPWREHAAEIVKAFQDTGWFNSRQVEEVIRRSPWDVLRHMAEHDMIEKRGSRRTRQYRLKPKKG